MTLTSGIDATSALVCGGSIGSRSLGTSLTLANVDGILAAKGDIVFGKAPNTSKAAYFGANLSSSDPASAQAIDAIFTTKDSLPLAFDNTGLDLQGLYLMLANLNRLSVSGDQLVD